MITKTIFIDKIKYLSGILVYRILLDLVYVFFVSPEYYFYMGLTTEIVLYKVILSYALLIIAAFVTGYKKNYLSHVFLNIQLLIMLIPMLSLYALSDRSTAFTLAVCAAYVAQCLVVWARHYFIDENMLSIQYGKQWMIFGVALLVACPLLYTFVKYGRASFTAFDLLKVYSIRADTGYSFPFSYLVPWAFKVLCIWIMLVALEHRRYLLALLSAVLQIYFYLIYANKATLFSLGLAVLCFVVVKYWDILKAMIVGLIGLLLSSAGIYVLIGNILPLSFLVRRSLFVPAVIRYAYYEYFAANEKLFFSQNSIGAAVGITSPYGMNAPKIIASFLGEPQSYCNSGYWGDAYANFGMAGVILFSLILVVLVLWVEKMAQSIPEQTVVPFMTVLFYYLNDGALFTWILGGGAGLGILLIWLYGNYHLRKRPYAKV